MTEDGPSHWTDFDSLYDLADPRPYFRGVETSGYRMPGVLAAVLRHLLPLVGKPGEGTRLVDFACGYGAVGLCLRYGLTMTDLYRVYAAPSDGDDPAYFKGLSTAGPEGTHITGLDIAGTALSYARDCGAIDAGLSENVLEDIPSETALETLRRADLVYESGAIGDHVAAAMEAILRHAAPNRPALLLCPRPRIGLAPLTAVLAEQGYELHTLAPEIRYRRAFSEQEMREEVAQGMANGLTAEECVVGDYFRVDMRLALPRDLAVQPFRDALQGIDFDAI